MKSVAIIVLAALLSLATHAHAETIRTRVVDPRGTTFLVTVDWEARAVMVDLRANPANLFGNELWDALQNAVYYGSAPKCSMKQAGVTFYSQSVLGNDLICPWFGEQKRQTS